MGRVTWMLALRQLRSAPRQSVLAASVVAVSVALVVFLNALIGGLQRRLLETTTGGIPHVVLEPAPREPVPVWVLRRSPDSVYVGTRSTRELRTRSIENWRSWVSWLEAVDQDIAVVIPTVEGPGVLTRESRAEPIRIVGADPDRFDRAFGLQQRLVAGRYRGLVGGEAVLGQRLADRLGLRLRDRFRVTGPAGTSTLLVAGIVRTGFPRLDDGVAFVTLRQAQSVLGLGTAVTTLSVRLQRPFEADRVADRIAPVAPFEVRSWMRENRQLLAGLQAQSQSSFLIQFFVTLAAGFGIVSILITNVLARLREIGILRAMGATRSQILEVFALQGTVLALTGGLVGAGVGVGLALLFYQARLSAAQPDIEVFPVDLNAGLVLGSVILSVVVGTLASLVPARQAAAVDPIRVIRST
ncbi:MAG: ABC transporter permease [bacterium]